MLRLHEEASSSRTAGSDQDAWWRRSMLRLYGGFGLRWCNLL